MKSSVDFFIAMIVMVSLMFFAGYQLRHVTSESKMELLELQIEERQLKIKQLKSGACINE